MRVLEIGTLFGGAIISLHDAGFGQLERLSFTVIDPLDGYYGKGVDPMTGEVVSQKTLWSNFGAAGINPDDVELVVGLSENPEIYEAVSRQEFDILLIDGDHSFTGVSSDWKNYAPLVGRGGLILVDDYRNDSWPDVTRFVDENLLVNPEVEMIFAGFDTAVFRVS